MNKGLKVAVLACFLSASFQITGAQESGVTPISSTEARQQADGEIQKARELLQQGFFDSAVVKYQDAFKIAPQYPAPYEELGKLMLERKNFAYAIQMYSKLTELEPRNPDYRRVAFNLYDAYEAPTEALQSGEVLLELGEADPDIIKRMASLYEKSENSLRQAQLMELYAIRTDAPADYWSQVSDTFATARRLNKAEDAVLVALDKEPENDRYLNSLARIYADQGKIGRAENIFEELAEKSPNDQGVRDELAQIYAQQGDTFLQKGRAHSALRYYDLATEYGSSSEVEDSAGVGLYKGTVNTADQVFNINDSAPGVGIATYRRAATGFSSLGETLGERHDAAELLLRPQYIFDADFGNSDINSYTLLDNVVRVPIRGTELDLRVRHSFRDVSSSVTGSATRNFIYAGANYNWNKDWSTLAYVGSQGLYDVTTLYEGDAFRGGVTFQRDVWAFTPVALGTDLTFNRQNLFGSVSIGNRFAIDGNVDFYQFNDNVDQTIFSIGASYQLLFEPGVQELQLSYIYSGQSNDEEVDPLIRFAPAGLTANSVGLDYSRVLTDWWRFNAGYFQSWINDGDSSGTWNVGSDFQLWKGAWLGLQYERGNFGGGTIAPSVQTLDSGNDNLNVNFGITF